MNNIEFVNDSDIYRKVLIDRVPQARRFVWLATSDLKDLYVDKKGKMVPFLEVLSDLATAGVALRLIHAKEVGPAFRKDFDRYRNLIEGLERLLCPRAHFKCVIVDGAFAYSGSANLTGAGMGAKSDNRRNFETGFITTDPATVKQLMSYFDSIWMGGHCKPCRRKKYCGEVGEMISR